MTALSNHPTAFTSNSSSSPRRFSGLDIFVVVERKATFYVLNVMLPVFILVTLSFISFFLDEADIAGRLSVTLTILLTLVALKVSGRQEIGVGWMDEG